MLDKNNVLIIIQENYLICLRKFDYISNQFDYNLKLYYFMVI